MELGQAKGEVVFKARSDDQRGEDRGRKQQQMQPISAPQGINNVDFMRPRGWLENLGGVTGFRHAMKPRFILPSWLRKVSSSVRATRLDPACFASFETEDPSADLPSPRSTGKRPGRRDGNRRERGASGAIGRACLIDGLELFARFETH